MHKIKKMALRDPTRNAFLKIRPLTLPTRPTLLFTCDDNVIQGVADKVDKEEEAIFNSFCTNIKQTELNV